MQSVHKLGISKAFRYENYGYIFLIEKKTVMKSMKLLSETVTEKLETIKLNEAQEEEIVEQAYNRFQQLLKTKFMSVRLLAKY